MGSQGGKGWWQNPVHPNASSVHFANSDPGCPAGCGASLACHSRVSRLSCTSTCIGFCRAVFDLSKDPGEHNDLSASLPQVKQQLLEALAAANRTAFQTNDTPGYTKCEAPAVVEARNRGFVGMVCTASEPEV